MLNLDAAIQERDSPTKQGAHFVAASFDADLAPDTTVAHSAYDQRPAGQQAPHLPVTTPDLATLNCNIELDVTEPSNMPAFITERPKA
ncbi:hypothetical protein [Stenotrophomonas maltophilia]|uniref:hypothetical protein n=1 Tax=Stenotrophomonas maltophilia TaxID=40324 RepID=UPI0013043C25|nr:hypothetical protein [Stenotrophomonas maltophilia]